MITDEQRLVNLRASLEREIKDLENRRSNLTQYGIDLYMLRIKAFKRQIAALENKARS